MIKLILLLLGLFVVENSGCRICDCPPLNSLVKDRDENEPLPPANCDPKNIVCNDYASILFNLTESELTFPNDPDPERYGHANAISKPTDLIDAYGIICENGLWYFTTSPFGVSYPFLNSVNFYHIFPEGNNKTKITSISCDGL